jgi:predicted ArsR family transcriptional regulator
VEFVAVNNRGGRGRPEKMYSISRAALGDNLASLTNALLDLSAQTMDVEMLAKTMLESNLFANLPIPKRLALLVEKLNEMHYQPRWEAGSDGPRFILARCPYARVIENHPELCKMDAGILQNALENKVEQMAKIDKAHGLCIFAMR